MIDIKNIDVSDFGTAIFAMRNSYSNWGEKDSLPYEIGENDLKLLKSLVKAGDSHSKCLRFINVTMDITAPLYWWKQFDTYKVGTVCLSTSTMHTITKKPFILSDFSHEHLTDKWENYNLVPYNEEYHNTPNDVLVFIVDSLNIYRNLYLRTGEKKYWWQIIQLLPESYNQMRTVQINYQTILNIIKQRKNHRLNEWHDFIEEMYRLPYIKELSEV